MNIFRVIEEADANTELAYEGDELPSINPSPNYSIYRQKAETYIYIYTMLNVIKSGKRKGFHQADNRINQTNTIDIT